MAKIQDPAWNAWTDKFLSLKGDQVQPMTPLQSQAFISMNFVERDETACKGIEGDLNKDFLYQVMAKRAEYYGLKYTVPLLAFWNCKFCNAYVGCHKEGSWVMDTASGERLYSDGTLPLGRLADRTLRGLKKATHQAFDPFWKSYALWKTHPAFTKDAKHDAARRKVLYQWLADTLGITYEDCHVGMFDEEQCRKVIMLCTQLQAAAKKWFDKPSVMPDTTYSKT